MSSSFGRLGRSLLKYLKPIRSTPAHTSPLNSVPALDANSRPLSLPRKIGSGKTKDNDQSKENLRLVPAPHVNLAEDELIPPKAPQQWLELVIFLLGACKRTAVKIKNKVAVNTYKSALAKNAQNKFRTVGNIIDITPEIYQELEDQKDEAGVEAAGNLVDQKLGS